MTFAEEIKQQCLENIRRMGGRGDALKLRESRGGLRPGDTFVVSEDGSMIELAGNNKAEKRARKAEKRQVREMMRVAEALGIPSEAGQRAFAEGRGYSRF